LLAMAAPSGSVQNLAPFPREAGWAATNDRKGPPETAGRTVGPEGGTTGGPAPQRGLRAARVGLEGRAAHTAPEGKAAVFSRAEVALDQRQWTSRGDRPR